jgi:prophage DNA circulation protein
MSWRDNLIQASFKGATFFVSTSDVGVGRRTEIYEFLDRGKPQILDLGEDIEEYRIEGYVIQNSDNNYDYFNERDALIFALKSQGSGTLKHPFLGEITAVHVGRARIREDFTNGGVARFSMTFVEDPVATDVTPIRTSSPEDLVDESNESLQATVADSLSSNYTTGGVFSDSTVTLIQDFLQNNITSLLTLSNTFVNQFVSEAVADIASLINTVDTIIDSPCDIATTITSTAQQFGNVVGLGGEVITGGVTGACSGEVRGEVTELDGTTIPEGIGLDTINAALKAASYTADEINDTPTEQLSNKKTLLDSNSALLLGVATTVAIRIDFSSQEKLVEVTEDILEEFDNLLESLGDGDNDLYQADIYQSVEDLRNVFATQIFEKGASLTKTVDYKVPSTILTTLNLAYDRYKNITRDDDIYQRNKPTVTHPGFLPGGDTIRILNE